MHCLCAWIFKPNTFHYWANSMLSASSWGERIGEAVTSSTQAMLQREELWGQSPGNIYHLRQMRDVKGAREVCRKYKWNGSWRIEYLSKKKYLFIHKNVLICKGNQLFQPVPYMAHSVPCKLLNLTEWKAILCSRWSTEQGTAPTGQTAWSFWRGNQDTWFAFPLQDKGHSMRIS